MTPSKVLLLLLRSRQHSQRGFGLLLALLAALVTMISAASLLIRGQAGLLGEAQQSEARMAREVAEAGLNAVISELNRPGNRRLLVSTVPFTSWQANANSTQSVDQNKVTNPCLYRIHPNQASSPQTRLTPSGTLLAMARQEPATVALAAPQNSRFRHRFILQSIRLSNGNRSRWYQSTRSGNSTTVTQSADPFDSSQIDFNTANTGHIELVVQGQLLLAAEDNDRVIASATVSREYEIVPKCCQRSLGGPSQIFGNDFRWCSTNPPFAVGLANDDPTANGGVEVVLNGASPELLLRGSSNEPPAEILCYMPASRGTACQGDKQITDSSTNKTVPVRTDAIPLPTLPGLNSSGLPCTRGTSGCSNTFDASKAYSIELFDYNNGASGNKPDERYAKDYLRVRPGGDHVEICNKTYTADPSDSNYAKPAQGNNPATIDTTPTIVAGSCVDLSDYCVKLDRDNLATYHCRIRNIFVNDFGATDDLTVRQNNTLFIDTSNGPIYLYIFNQWAKTRNNLSEADPVRQRMKDFGYLFDDPSSEYAPIYTVGGYNDGQIQHVHCPSYSDVAKACTDTTAAANEMTRAEIISDIANAGISTNGTSNQDYAALIGDDGFVRDLFFWMPYASFHLAGDPTTIDVGGNLAQGKPQLSAGLWVNTFRFTRRPSQLYLPSRASQFFPYLLSPRDRLASAVHDWVARTSSLTSLFR